MAKPIKLKDRLANQILPVTRATLVEMNDGLSLQTAYDAINSTHYTKAEINEMGYLQNYTETDPTVPSYVKGITQTDITKWNNTISKYVFTFEDNIGPVPTIEDYSSLSTRIINGEIVEGHTIALGSLNGAEDIYYLQSYNFSGDDFITFINGKGTRVLTFLDGDTPTVTSIDYITPTQLNNASYVSKSELNTASYVSSTSLNTTLTSYATSANYDSNTKKIYLKHGTTTLSEIDATDFIKDGMVDTAYVQGTNLIISFNTDAGKEAVNVPISDIFNANNYYTKSEIDNASYIQWAGLYNTGIILNTKGTNGPDGYDDGSIYFNNLGVWIAQRNDGISIEDNDWDTRYLFPMDRKGIVALTDDFNSYVSKTELNAAGYITSFTETDPTVPSHVKSITQQNITDWNNKLSSETQLSKGTTTGNGNAVTDISVSNHQITLTKGSTFLTSHQDIKTINNQTITGTGNVTINELPTVSSTDNGKVLQVVNGQWQLVTPLNLYSGTGAPDNSQGNNGDLYMQI